MSAFKAIKSVCKRCMDETRVPLSHNGGPETRDPVPWNDLDEERWENTGKVICPQAGGAAKPMRQFCLRYKEVDAMNDGKVFVWSETEEKS